MNSEDKKSEITFEDYNAYTEKSVVSISDKGIDLGELGFIGFQECADNFNKTHGCSIKCVGERDILDHSFTFYTSTKPTMIKFISKNKFLEFFTKENTDYRFYKLQKQIVQYGYSTYDMT